MESGELGLALEYLPRIGQREWGPIKGPPSYLYWVSAGLPKHSQNQVLAQRRW